MPLIFVLHCVNYSREGFRYSVAIIVKNESCDCKQKCVWNKKLPSVPQRRMKLRLLEPYSLISGKKKMREIR